MIKISIRSTKPREIHFIQIETNVPVPLETPFGTARQHQHFDLGG